jgi:hypothetical protein
MYPNKVKQHCRMFSTRIPIQSKGTIKKMKELQKDRFELSKQGLLYRECDVMHHIDDPNKISYFEIICEEKFAQTLYDITIHIKRKLESSFNVMRKPELITPEEYHDPTTKKLPLYIQPRPIESLTLCLFYGETALAKLPPDELERWYNHIVIRMEESGFVHHRAKLTETNIAHPDDFYFTLMKTNQNNQIVQTFPSPTHHLLICNIQASLALYRLYEDLQIISNRIPGLRRNIVHRNNGQLRKQSRRPIWIPQIVLADIVNGMEGCKKEERTLRNICSKLELEDEIVEQLNFQPTGISLRGYRPTSSNNDTQMDWDFTFQQLTKAERPQLPDWVDGLWRDDEE